MDDEGDGAYDAVHRASVEAKAKKGRQKLMSKKEQQKMIAFLKGRLQMFNRVANGEPAKESLGSEQDEEAATEPDYESGSEESDEDKDDHEVWARKRSHRQPYVAPNTSTATSDTGRLHKASAASGNVLPAIGLPGGIETPQPAASDDLDDGLLHVMTEEESNERMRKRAATMTSFDKPLGADENLFGEDDSDVADLSNNTQPSGSVLPTSKPAMAATGDKKRKRSDADEAESMNTSQPVNKARKKAETKMPQAGRGGKKKAGPK